MKFSFIKAQLVNSSPIGVIALHFLYTIEPSGRL
nr:MAG TPA_asm: hypothetical protein [Caudoviricetes sp.]